MNRPFLSLNRQRGIGLLGMLIIFVFIACVVLVGLRAIPSVLEYQAVVKTIQHVRTEGTIPAVRAAFNRGAQIDDITSITGDDLDIKPGATPEQGFVVSFAYRKEIPLVGPASLLLDYKGSTR